MAAGAAYVPICSAPWQQRGAEIPASGRLQQSAVASRVDEHTAKEVATPVSTLAATSRALSSDGARRRGTLANKMTAGRRGVNAGWGGRRSPPVRRTGRVARV